MRSSFECSQVAKSALPPRKEDVCMALASLVLVDDHGIEVLQVDNSQQEVDEQHKAEVGWQDAKERQWRLAEEAVVGIER